MGMAGSQDLFAVIWGYLKYNFDIELVLDGSMFQKLRRTASSSPGPGKSFLLKYF